MLPGNACSWTSSFDKCPDVPDTAPDYSHDKKNPRGPFGQGPRGQCPPLACTGPLSFLGAPSVGVLPVGCATQVLLCIKFLRSTDSFFLTSRNTGALLSGGH